MDRDTLVEDLRTEITTRLLQGNNGGLIVKDGMVTAEFVHETLQAIESLGVKLVPSNVEMDWSRVSEFESLVSRWNANGNVEPIDVNGQQILMSLISDGWLILPPQ